MKNKAKKQKIMCRENSRIPVPKRAGKFPGAQKNLPEILVIRILTGLRRNMEPER
jgi:hypothetical protein